MRLHSHPDVRLCLTDPERSDGISWRDAGLINIITLMFQPFHDYGSFYSILLGDKIPVIGNEMSV